MNPSKFLFSTLVAAAAMTATAYAENYTVSGAVSEGRTNDAWNGKLVYSNGGTVVDVTSNDTFTFDGADGYLPGWSDGSFVGNITLADDKNATSAFVWTDGSSSSVSTITFTGSLTGSGTFEKNTNSNNKKQCFVFAGDLSGFGGNFKLADAEANNTGTLTFGNGGVAITGTYEGGVTAKSVSGTGVISWNGQSVVYNYDNTNAATIGNSSISAKNLTFQGGASYTLNSTTTVSSALTVAENTTLTVAGTVALSSAITNMGTVTATKETVFSLANLEGVRTDNKTAFTLVNGGTTTWADGMGIGNVDDINRFGSGVVARDVTTASFFGGVVTVTDGTAG
ncbi:MAG: hypothetical protein IJY80_03315, partial [Opitutales bacterium]|nr:hypothetical protein [Opitutales bacterium]